jgi:integrase
MPTVNFYLKKPAVDGSPRKQKPTNTNEEKMLEYLKGRTGGKLHEPLQEQSEKKLMDLVTRNDFKKSATPDAKCLIYMQVKYSGQKLVYSFGQKIEPKFWDDSKQRVKGVEGAKKAGKDELNGLLNALEKEFIIAYNKEIKNGIPAPRTLKQHLDNFLYQNLQENTSQENTLFKLINRFVAGEIKFRGRDKTKGSLNNYNSVLKHLVEFQKKKGYKVDFETITLDFFYQYVTFLKNAVKLSQNTIAKDITLLKVFMSEAIDLGYTNNLQFKHKKFTVSTVDTDAVYLTENEILALYRFNLSETPKLERVRDLFVFGCFTGLRFSDYSNIRPENVVQIEGDLFIKLVTQKTQDLVIIPCNPVILELFKKYESNYNKLPRTISGQKFNDYIRDACKAAGKAASEAAGKPAGMNETGRLSTDPSLQLWQCISSHTARRSFATNLYLQGFPTIDLMKITGHKTEKAFLKYIRVSKLDTAKRLNEHIKKNWSSTLLRVAS